MTTVEARGTTQPIAGCREHNRRGDLGRAAGAQLTGQRQDGPSQGPADAQHPRAAHGGAGSFTTIYGVVHDALLTGAAMSGVTTQDVRLLLALAERGGTSEGASHDLVGAFGSNSTAIRRSALALADAGLILNTSRRGVGMRLSITGRGHDLAMAMLGYIKHVLAERNGTAASREQGGRA